MINAIARVVAREHWEIIADNLKKPDGVGVASQRWILLAERSGLLTHRDDGKRFVVRADEKLTAFVELESVLRACGELTTRYEPLRVGLTRKI
jgi:hypothetical protein